MNCIIQKLTKLTICSLSQTCPAEVRRSGSLRQFQIIRLIQTDLEREKTDFQEQVLASKNESTYCERSSKRKRDASYKFSAEQIYLMYGWVLKSEQLYSQHKGNRRWSFKYTDKIVNLVKEHEKPQSNDAELTKEKLQRAIEKLRLHIDREGSYRWLDGIRERIDLDSIELPFNLINPTNVHRCEHCTKSFSTLKNLEKHVLNVHSGKLFKCSLCDKIYHQKASLKRHITRNHQ